MKKSPTDNLRGAIVLGGHVQSLGIVRILGQRGKPVIVVDNTSHGIARRSNYCQAFFKVSDKKLLEFLEGPECMSKYSGWIIFPTNDLHVRILAMNRERLMKSYLISTDRWETVEIFYNKRNTYRLAEKTGIPIPITFFPENGSDLDNPDIPFPCVVKPAVMIEFYRKTGKKVYLCSNRNELKAAYDKALKVIAAEEIIIQEMIPGDGKEQFSACFLFLGGISYSELTVCRLRQHPVDFGNATTYAETVEEPVLIEYSKRLLSDAGYNGLCEVEFKRDSRDGSFRLLEVNPRTWKWHSISEMAGIPFLPLYFNYLEGKQIKPVSGHKPASFCHGATDLPVRLILMLKGLGNWKRRKPPVQNAVWSSHDPAPWFYEKLYLMDFLINR